MRWRWVVLACVVASACGRVGFDSATFDDLCMRDGVTICESFEGDTAASWDFEPHDRLPVVTTDQSYSANHSLLTVGGNPMGRYSDLSEPNMGLIPDPSFYARAWIYLPSADTIGHVNLITLNSSDGGYSLVAIDDGLGEGPIIELFTDADIGAFNVGAPPRDRWFCIELQVDLGASGRAKGTVDSGGSNENSVEMTGDTTLVGGALENLYLGASYSGPNQDTQIRVYLDDFLLSRDPVGCYP